MLTSNEESATILPTKDMAGELIGKHPVEDITTTVIGPEYIDQYGHVNYKAYPILLEPSQDAYMESRGVGFKIIEDKFGLRSVVKTYTPTINHDLKAGDQIQIRTGVSRLGKTSITYQQSITRGGIETMDYSMVVILINNEGKPTNIPQEIRDAISVIPPAPQADSISR